MKSLSYWASSHPLTARTIIVCCHLLVAITALLFGFLTYDLGFEFGAWATSGSLLFFALAIVLYPAKKNGRWGSSFGYRKSLDFSLVALTFAMIACSFNQFCFSPAPTSTTIYAADAPRASFIVLMEKSPTKAAGVIRGWKAKVKNAKHKFKKGLKSKVREFRKKRRLNKQKGFSTGTQILLIILSVFVGLIAFMVIALLGCSLACSGAEGLGVAIIFAGIGGIGVGLFFIIRSIIRKGENYKGRKKKVGKSMV